MKSKPNYIVVLVVVGLSLYGVIRFLGWVQFYNLPSPSMMPNYPVGKMLIASSLATPGRQDVVAYNSIGYGYHPGPDLFLGRIVATGGDGIEIRNGYVFIDGVHSEENLDLAFGYAVTDEILNDLGLKLYDLEPTMHYRTGEGIVLFVSDSELSSVFKNRKFDRMTHKFTHISDFVMKEHIEPEWTDLNYGPITIPENHYFILGDNRSNSQDSRLRGFIHEDYIEGVVLN